MENNSTELTQTQWTDHIYAEKPITQHCRGSFQFPPPGQFPRHHLHFLDTLKQPHLSPSVVPRNRPQDCHTWLQTKWAGHGTTLQPGKLCFLELLDTQRKLPTNAEALPMSCHPTYWSHICLQSATQHAGHSSLLCSQTWRHSSETRNMSSLHYRSAIPTWKI